MPVTPQAEKEKLKAYGIDEEKLQMLKGFVMLLKHDSNVLSFSCLKFFKDWLVNEYVFICFIFWFNSVALNLC